MRRRSSSIIYRLAPVHRRTEARMSADVTRREFVSALALLPFAAEAFLAGQTDNARSVPVIDTHIHLFDKTRPEGAPYPRDLPGGGEPPTGMIALANRYRAFDSPP